MTDEVEGAVRFSSLSEDAFAEHVDALVARGPAGSGELIGLLDERHPVYDGRAAAAIARMRGWILVALSRRSLPEEAMVFVLEELESGIHAYPVAAAARALRSHDGTNAAFAPFLLRALENVRYHDEPVSFEAYGVYPDESTGSTAVGEVIETLGWLGPAAASTREALRRIRDLPSGAQRELERVLEAIPSEPARASSCCGSARAWPGERSGPRQHRTDPGAIEAVSFEDHDGRALSFAEFFHGRPCIVVFFYTRCDNPQKCSLTVTKLGRVQAMLAERGLRDRVRTAAITYDPAYDRPERLRRYGADRRTMLDSPDHRLLRAVDGFEDLREYFELGVGFAGSVVNRHKIELYVLDGHGHVAACFDRLHWNEDEVIDRAVTLLSQADRGGCESSR